MEKKIYNPVMENLMLEAVESFFSAVREVAKEKEKVYVALSGGRSLVDFYKDVAHLNGSLEKRYWEKIMFCFADERVVPPEDEQSNYRQLKEVFLGELLSGGVINEDQILIINPLVEDVAGNYSAKIEGVDIVLLGSGEDGHVASLFPLHPSVNDGSMEFINVFNSPKLPAMRVSMSRNMIGYCRYSFVFFIGDEKKKAYERFNDEVLKIEECPAKAARDAKNCYVVTDLAG